MGSSTGNLLVDNPLALENIFASAELLIATHCEDEKIIRDNFERLKREKACWNRRIIPLSAMKKIVSNLLSKPYNTPKHNARLHILHISTEKELQLFGNMAPLKDKRITAEVCVHHLHFTSDDYARLGNQIKCNPAIKAPNNRSALWQAFFDDRLDVIATDHAPHTWEEKNEPYEKAHAGLPLVQHSPLLMLHYVKEGKLSVEKVVEKMSHAVATCFQVRERGYIREGYHADLVLVDMHRPTTVSKENILLNAGGARWKALYSRQQ